MSSLTHVVVGLVVFLMSAGVFAVDTCSSVSGSRQIVIIYKVYINKAKCCFFSLLNKAQCHLLS